LGKKEDLTFEEAANKAFMQSKRSLSQYQNNLDTAFMENYNI